MGQKLFSAREILVNVVYDVQRVLNDNESSKTAYHILQRKMEEIRKIEQTPYLRLQWD